MLLLLFVGGCCGSLLRILFEVVVWGLLGFLGG